MNKTQRNFSNKHPITIQIQNQRNQQSTETHESYHIEAQITHILIYFLINSNMNSVNLFGLSYGNNWCCNEDMQQYQTLKLFLWQ